LYDNMKVVVMRYDGEEPVYNPRFLAFATHYQFRPWACRRWRPRTKGKVERPFNFVETNLLNARTFRSLEHLNQVAAQWLETIADVRDHRTTKRRPIDLLEEEREHLRQLPDHPYEVSEVVYRIVNAEGMVQWRANWYPVPWHLIGRLLPVKATEGELIVYDHHIEECARHDLFPRSVTGQRAPSNRRYPRPEGVQSDQALRERFRTLGERGIAFLEGLLNARRCGRSEAVKILSLLETWRREDLIAAITRAARFRAYSHPTIERILSAEASPLSALELLEQRSRDGLEDLVDGAGVEPRPTSDYQGLLEDDENPDAGDGDDQDHDEDAEPSPA
jgi:hypothetical protein